MTKNEGIDTINLADFETEFGNNIASELGLDIETSLDHALMT
jgi:hypothetical protein